MSITLSAAAWVALLAQPDSATRAQELAARINLSMFVVGGRRKEVEARIRVRER